MAIKQLEGLGELIFNQRYANGNETWAQRARAIAKHAASAETDSEKEKWEKKFFEVVGSGDLIPGGRIIYGSGRSRQNMLNCYAITPDDSVASIAKTIADAYKISCGGGGIGFSFSKIRPKGDDIQNIKFSAPGSVSVIKMINEIGSHVKAGKNRRTALIAILHVEHPDILEFLHVKLDKKELNNFNISVAITDDFIEACKTDKPWVFKFGNKNYYVYQVDRISKTRETINVVATSVEDALGRADSHFRLSADDTFENVVKYDLKARDLWTKLWENAVETGCPGIYNHSLINKFTNVSYFETLDQSNPCGELPLPSYGNCCLGNINLSNMVENGQVDWKKLANTVRLGIRFLDNILTANYFPVEECREVGHRSRRIGLGVMGLHYMLIKLGIRYGDEKCLELLERLFATIRNEAYLTSMYLSEEKGTFPSFDAEKYLNEEFSKTLPARIRMLIRKNGIRNAVMLTIPPTGTISMVHETSSGLEPIFAPIYLRRFREANVWREVPVVDPLLKSYYLSGVEVDRLKHLFVGAYDITPSEHMAVQATIQKFTDSSLSKTINLPSTAQAADFADLALEYAPYLKGMTVYRAASKENEPLSVIPLTKENLDKYVGSKLVKTESSSEEANFCVIGDGSCGS